MDGLISNNEGIVGSALKDIRDKVVIASKFGVTHNLDCSPETIKKFADEKNSCSKSNCKCLFL